MVTKIINDFGGILIVVPVVVITAIVFYVIVRLITYAVYKSRADYQQMINNLKEDKKHG
jgi:hypothetical protein